MIVGNIYKGIKRIIEFNLRAMDDNRDIVSINKNLIARLASMNDPEKTENILNGVEEIDRILN